MLWLSLSWLTNRLLYDIYLHIVQYLSIEIPSTLIYARQSLLISIRVNEFCKKYEQVLSDKIRKIHHDYNLFPLNIFKLCDRPQLEIYLTISIYFLFALATFSFIILWSLKVFVLNFRFPIGFMKTKKTLKSAFINTVFSEKRSVKITLFLLLNYQMEKLCLWSGEQ